MVVPWRKDSAMKQIGEYVVVAVIAVALFVVFGNFFHPSSLPKQSPIVYMPEDHFWDKIIQNLLPRPVNPNTPPDDHPVTIATNSQKVQFDFDSQPSTNESALTQNFGSRLLQSKIAYELYADDYRRRVFEWQLTSSKIIFWLVFSIVVAGIVFSASQFGLSIYENRHIVRRRNDKPVTPPAAKSTEESVTEFEASADGIKLKSSTLGVIILTISLVFFYLYLVHVYPVKEVEGQKGNVSQNSASQTNNQE